MSTRFSTIEELARHFNMSVSTARTWIKNGTIPDNLYFKVGNTQRFDIAAIEEHILESNGGDTVPSSPAPEIEEQLDLDLGDAEEVFGDDSDEDL